MKTRKDRMCWREDDLSDEVPMDLEQGATASTSLGEARKYCQACAEACRFGRRSLKSEPRTRAGDLGGDLGRESRSTLALARLWRERHVGDGSDKIGRARLNASELRGRGS